MEGNWTWLEKYPHFSSYTTQELRAEYLLCKSFFSGKREGACLCSFSGDGGMEADEYIEWLSLELFERFLDEKERIR
jgi:hypothetical protein